MSGDGATTADFAPAKVIEVNEPPLGGTMGAAGCVSAAAGEISTLNNDG
jgi:hypothetical protein